MDIKITVDLYREYNTRKEKVKKEIKELEELLSRNAVQEICGKIEILRYEMGILYKLADEIADR